MAVLFTLGVYQEDRPQRWQSKHRAFINLSHALQKLGMQSYFLCNPLSVKRKLIVDDDLYFFHPENSIKELIGRLDISCVFVWGGRLSGDARLREEIAGQAKIIYAESGWFPQAGNCYFSNHGTNADARLMEEGLAEHQLDVAEFAKARSRALRPVVGFLQSFRLPDFFRDRTFDTKKPILLPLQDESDTNIVLSSPVKSMAAFIRRISEQYPDATFIARPHPRASYDTLPTLRNVEYQSPSVNPYKNYRDYGGVIGINSTMLLQYALIGLPVAALGRGLATGCQAFLELNFDSLPQTLAGLSYPASPAAKFFDFLIGVKQLRVKDLSDPAMIQRSYLGRWIVGSGT